MKRFRRILGIVLAGALVLSATIAYADNTDTEEAAVGGEAILLSETDLQLSAGETETLDAEVTPAESGETVSDYTSSDEGVATVDEEGNVTGVSEGTAEITASTESGLEASSAVTVQSVDTEEDGNAEDVPAETTVSFSKDGTERDSLTLFGAGDAEELSVSLSPEDTTDTIVGCESADPSVATAAWDESDPTVVTVTGVGVGTTEITATTANGASAVCTVVVQTVTVDDMQLKVGGSEELTVEILPDGEDTVSAYFSSDVSVATIDESSGMVTAVGAGTAEITVTTAKGMTASGTVTVTANSTQAGDGAANGYKDNEVVELNHWTLLCVVGETDTLRVTFTPRQCDKVKRYASSDTTVATVDQNGKVTAVGAGTCKITVYTRNGLRAVCSVEVYASGSGGSSSGTSTLPGTTYSTSAASSIIKTATSKYTMPENIPDKVNLTFTSSLDENTDEILDSLYGYDDYATFFVHSDDIYTEDDRVRRIVGEGHAVGILLTAEQVQDADTALSALEQANEKLSTTCGVPTRLIAIDGGSEGTLAQDVYSVLLKNGYRVWDWEYNPEEDSNGSSTAITNTEKALDTKGTLVVRMGSSKETASTVKEVLSFMDYAKIPTQALSDSDTPVCTLDG